MMLRNLSFHQWACGCIIASLLRSIGTVVQVELV
jgi:hypothetical protein